jgi:hypothetical protein
VAGLSGQKQETKMTNADISPKWETAAQSHIAALLDEGNQANRDFAIKELLKMARLADLYVESQTPRRITLDEAYAIQQGRHA